jgi:hypothetical protein
MAKKAVASLQTGSKKLAKAIRMIKKDGSNSYSFEERILPQELVNDWLAGKPIVKKEIPTPVQPAAEVKAEEPAAEVKAEEPAAEVKAEEPTAEEVKAEEPVAEEVKAEEPTAEEVKAEEPAAEDKPE